MSNTIEVTLTKEQEKTLIQYAITRILEEKMEAEIDKEIKRIHAVGSIG